MLFSLLHHSSKHLWCLYKVTVCFPEGAERRNPTNVTSTGHNSCLSLPTCARVCRDPGQAVSPGMGRPHSGDPLWSHTCCLKERRWQAAAKSRLFPISKAFPSLSETLEVAGNDGGAQAGTEVPAKGSAGSGQGPGYFSVNDIVISCGFPSRCVCCK